MLLHQQTDRPWCLERLVCFQGHHLANNPRPLLWQKHPHFQRLQRSGTNTLPILTEAIGMLDSHNKVIVLGDFNLHHPLWSATHRRASYRPSPQHLLTIIEDFQLQLLTVPGTPTHRWKDGESTIDLTFAF